MKIQILGGSGSGKTTLARSLSSQLHVPHYDLDQIGWTHGTDILAHIREARAIAERPEWVAEGNHIVWTDALMRRADYIVLLEVPWPVAAWRIIRRHIIKSLQGTNPYPGVKILFNFLQDTRRFYKGIIRPGTPIAEAVEVYLVEQRGDVELPEAEILQARLERCMVAIPLTMAFVRRHLEKYKDKVFIVKNSRDRKRLFELLTKRPML